jgi:malate dehydrogenase (oxaloacetate-decarboxylating)
MRQKASPLLAAMVERKRAVELSHQTSARGLNVLNSPKLNKGMAFTAEERAELGLTGLLPPVIVTLAAQSQRAYFQYEQLPDALSKNIYLTALHDRNEVLFYRLISEHLREMIPIVNDFTVGQAMKQYHHESRRPRGVYLSIDHPGAIEEAFANFGAGTGDIDLILATDAGQILGLGDWGIGGIEVAIGKLAIYTAAGGIDPARVMPVMLDVGTNREELLADPMYAGNRHARIRGDRYDAFIDAYVRAAMARFPNALMQWEDFSPLNARRILKNYRGSLCTFNDDMQGTGAIALAAAISAVRICGTAVRTQRIVIFGAGTAGMGIADQLRGAMVQEGLTPEAAARNFWCVDRQGLLTTSMPEPLHEYQAAYARPASESKSWKREPSGGIGLAEVVKRIKPTMLIGASGAGGSFTEAIIRNMAAHTERPIIFALSIPRIQAEATTDDLIAWTDGRALIATGASSVPVTYRGVTYVAAQLSNALLYPGLGLGTIVSRARHISDGMFAAAASAVSSLVTVFQPGASLLPQIDDLRRVSLVVAVAVAEAAEQEGLATVALRDVVQQVRDSMWQPEYRRIEAIA